MTPPRTRDRLDAWAVAVVVLLCALWGFQQVSVKLAVQAGLPAVMQAALRSAGAAALCVLWIAAREGRAAAAGLFRRDAFFWPGVLLAAIFGVEFTLLYTGVRLTSASRAVLFLYTTPFFTALAAHLLIPGERLRWSQGLGLVIAFAGVAAAFADGLLDGHGDIRGDLMCAGSAMLWACATLTIKLAPGVRGVKATRLLAFQLGGSVPFLLLAAAGLGELRPLGDVTALGWALLAYQTVVVAFASYLAWFWLLLIYPAGRLSGFTFLTPLFGILGGGLALGETLTLGLLAGLAAITVGLRLVNRRPPAASA